MFTYYKGMKHDKNAKIGVVWGLWVPEGHQQHNHLIQRHTTSYATLIETMHLSCTIFEL